MNYSCILLVDDSSTSRMIMKRCFEIAGFFASRFLEAEDGIMALTVLQNHSIDLIVTDIRMPKMDGITFIKKLKVIEMAKEIPVVVVSSLTNDPLESQLIREGVMSIIKKPISPQKVILAMKGEGDEHEKP